MNLPFISSWRSNMALIIPKTALDASGTYFSRLLFLKWVESASMYLQQSFEERRSHTQKSLKCYHDQNRITSIVDLSKQFFSSVWISIVGSNASQSKKQSIDGEGFNGEVSLYKKLRPHQLK
jgi:hypothetical protein